MMCNIWRDPNPSELALDEIEHLLSDPVLSGLRTVTLTGGEPFLRRDLADICELFERKCNDLIQIYISTNGSEDQAIKEQVSSILRRCKSMSRLRIGISFDHVGEKHDQIRGKKGIHERCLRSVRQLQELSEDRLFVQANVAIGPYNIEDLDEIHRYFREIGLKVFWFPIMISENFYMNEDRVTKLMFSPSQRSQLEKFIHDLVGQAGSLNDLYYYSGLLESLRKNRRTLPCSAGGRFLHINAEGEVFPCYVIPKNFKFGSIRERSLQEIWHSQGVESLRRSVRNSEVCATCHQWYDGFALSEHLSFLLRCLSHHPISASKTTVRYLMR